MKSNHNATGGQLLGVAGDNYHKTWARYYSKFLDAYQAHGIDFFAITAQNEPTQDVPWDSCYFDALMQRDFIKTDLGPELRRTHPEVKLLILDDQRDLLPDFPQVVLEDPDAAKYVSGIGVHWYAESEDIYDDFDLMVQTHSLFPNVFIMATEACEGYLPWSQGPSLGNFERGLTYAHDILGDLNAFSAGWTDWNLMLDASGGPNHAGNVVDAPIILDTENRTVFYKNPMYYALGHFSKFIVPNSVRIECNSTSSLAPVVPPLEATAFLTPPPDSHVVLVVLNRDLQGRSFSIYDVVKGEYVLTRIKRRTIQTYVYGI